MTKKRKKIDWEKIEIQFRAGSLSVDDIAEMHDLARQTIYKKARNSGWERNLIYNVREATQAKLITIGKEADIVNQAASEAAAVVLSHREDISRLRKLESQLLDRIESDELQAIIYRGKITDKLPLGIEAVAKALAYVSGIQQKRITLERQAYHMDDPTKSKQASAQHMSDDEIEAELAALQQE